MVKKLGTMWFKHALPVLFMNGRDDMAGFIVSYFTAEGYDKIRNRKEKRDGKDEAVEDEKK